MLKMKLKHFALVTSLITFSPLAFSGSEEEDKVEKKEEKKEEKKVDLRKAYSVPAKETHVNRERRAADSSVDERLEELCQEQLSQFLTRKEEISHTGLTTGDPTQEESRESPEESEVQKWIKKLVVAIQKRDLRGFKFLLSQHPDSVNLNIPGDGRNLLMVAMEQVAPDDVLFEIVRDLLDYFDLNNVPGNVGYNYLSYYEQFKPEIFAHAGMEKIITLLMQHLPNQEPPKQPNEDHSRKVLKKKSEETKEKWLKKLIYAIRTGNHVLVRSHTDRHRDWANEIIPEDVGTRTLLMFALEQRPPCFEVIRELLKLHFHMNFVPGQPNGTTYVTYYRDLLAKKEMENILGLLMEHEWLNNEGQYISLAMLANPIYNSLHSSASSAGSTSTNLHSSTSEFSQESTTTDDGQPKKKVFKIIISGANWKASSSSGTTSRPLSGSSSSATTRSSTSSLLSSSGSSSAHSKSHSSRTNDSGSSRQSPKPNNNSPKPVTNNNSPTVEENTTTASTTVQPEAEPEVKSGGITTFVVKTLSWSSSKREEKKDKKERNEKKDKKEKKKRRSSAAAIVSKST